MNYIKIVFNFLFLVLFFTLGAAKAENVEVAENEQNCKKVNGYATKDKTNIAISQGVSSSSVQFVGAAWESKYWDNKNKHHESNVCVFVFASAKGPITCQPHKLLSGDGGRTVFGLITMSILGTEVVLCQQYE